LDIFLQLIFNGLLMGSFYCLLSLGLSIQTGVMKVVNFAYGSLIMISMYTTYWFYSVYNVPLFLTVLISILLFFVLNYLIQSFLLSGNKKTISEEKMILCTLGIGILLENLALMLWGATPRGITSISDSLFIGNFFFPVDRIIILIIALGLIVIFHVLLHYTWLGKAIRATAQDYKASLLMGIDARSVFNIVSGITGVLIAIAGATLVGIYNVSPSAGANFTLLAFTVIVLGGTGSLIGTLVSGLLLGIVGALVSFYLSSGLEMVFFFLIFVVALLIKPEGLFSN